MKLLHDNTPSLLIDVYRMLPEDNRREFKQVSQVFANGLNATITGAAFAMRQWIRRRNASGHTLERWKRFLAVLDAVQMGSLDEYLAEREAA